MCWMLCCDQSRGNDRLVECKLDNAKRGIPSQGGESWSWPLTSWPKINRVPPLIMNKQLTCEVWKWPSKNCSLYHAHNVLQRTYESWPWPLIPWPKINRFPPLIMNNLHIKFESDRAKTVVCIVPTRFYRLSAKVDLGLWPRDPKSIGFLLSSWWMCKWSLKVIGQKL